jgi:hypothetical protein
MLKLRDLYCGTVSEYSASFRLCVESSIVRVRSGGSGSSPNDKIVGVSSGRLAEMAQEDPFVARQGASA